MAACCSGVIENIKEVIQKKMLAARCIIYLERLSAKKFFPDFNEVLNSDTKIVNEIRS